ncbi:MAG: cupin [Proteobacteria bacterium]|nr:cupin [Pseudomonadota bacterium]
MNEFGKIAVNANTAPIRTTASNYPEEFARRMLGRTKRPLGSLFGISNFGVNLTTLSPGAVSALRHSHSKQEEFVFVLEGTLILRTDEGDTLLSSGMCAGFRAATGNAHQLINISGDDAVYLEIGDRTAGDEVSYPDDNLQAVLANGSWQFKKKNGESFAE